MYSSQKVIKFKSLCSKFFKKMIATSGINCKNPSIFWLTVQIQLSHIKNVLLSSNSLLTPRGIYFGGPSTYLPLAKKLPFQNTILTVKPLWKCIIFWVNSLYFAIFFTIMYYSNTYQHRKLSLWRYNGHISFYRVQISWNIRMNQGWIKDESGMN